MSDEQNPNAEPAARPNRRKVREGIVVSAKMQETRPLSKLKRWRVVEVLERAR